MRRLQYEQLKVMAIKEKQLDTVKKNEAIQTVLVKNKNLFLGKAQIRGITESG